MQGAGGGQGLLPRRGYCAASRAQRAGIPRRRGFSAPPDSCAASQPRNYIFIQILLDGDRLQFVSQWHLLLVLETLLRGSDHQGRAGAAFQSVAKRAAGTN